MPLDESKEESEELGLKLSIQKMKIMASSPITSWQIDGEIMETVTDFIFFSSVQFSHSVVSNSVRPHRWQPTRLPRPWDSPSKNTGVGCHFLLQCMKVKSESEVAQSLLRIKATPFCKVLGKEPLEIP